MAKRFMTKKDMAAAKHCADIAYSRAKREGKKLFGVHQIHCGCGAEGCFVTLPKAKEQ